VQTNNSSLKPNQGSASAFLLSVLLRKSELHKVTFRDALMFASLTWVLTGFLGALPIHLVTDVSMTDAVFESISALTTTGATILTGSHAQCRRNATA